MTYNLDSDLPNLYGKFSPVFPHPAAGSEELDRIIRDFADSHKHLAQKEEGALAVQFVSHCPTQSRRNVIVHCYTECHKYVNVTKSYIFYKTN